MGTDFLALAAKWRDAADALRAAGVPADDPALGVWREAAWVHVLLDRGLYPYTLVRLVSVARVVSRNSHAHGVSVAGDYDFLRATVAFLTIDQISYYLRD